MENGAQFAMVGLGSLLFVMRINGFVHPCLKSNGIELPGGHGPQIVTFPKYHRVHPKAAQ